MSSPFSEEFGSPSPGPVQPTPVFQSGRPTGVTVFAIVCTLFGVIGLLSPVITLIPMFLNFGPNPVNDVIEQNVVYRFYFFAMIGIGFLFSILLLASGIGLFKMAAWARTGVLFYAAFSIVSVLLGVVMNFLFLMGPLLENVAANGGPELPPEIAGPIVLASSIASSCFGLVLPVALLIYFLMPSVKRAFQAQAVAN